MDLLCKIIVILSATLSVVSICYGFVILSVASGSNFYLFWIVLGTCLLALAIIVRFGWYRVLPGWVPVLFGMAVFAVIAIYAFFAAKILTVFDSRCDSALDAVIVLGAQVRDDGPSVVLRYRLDCAADYLMENPGTVCIVTGAKGTNEPVSEAAGMADYLVSAGIDADRIIPEDRAVNTVENICFSKKLLPSEIATVGIVTNNFHMYRALGIAKKQGLLHVSGLAAESTPLFLPNNVTREVLGVLKDLMRGNMVFW